MTLLIEYLEEETGNLVKLRENVKNLMHEFIKTGDPDLRKEVAKAKRELRIRHAEIMDYLLVHLEEIYYFQRYYPDLLQTFVEDPIIGPLISKRLWLL